MFLTLFVIGAAGFLTMAFLSFGHIGGGHHSFHAGGHTGHVGHVGHGHVGHTHSGNSSYTGMKGRWLPWGWFSLTPIDVFSYCLGFGAAGLILEHALKGNLLIWAAIGCAIAYNLLLIHPIMSLAMKFVSRESQGLEGAVSSEAEACGKFDNLGRGIVRLTLDGQIVQLLATLDAAELARGVNVSRGDRVVILEVDGTRNRCRVSRDLAA